MVNALQVVGSTAHLELSGAILVLNEGSALDYILCTRQVPSVVAQVRRKIGRIPG